MEECGICLHWTLTGNEKVFNVREGSMYPCSEYLEVGWNINEIKGNKRNMIISLKNLLSLPHFLHIVKNFTCSAFEKYHLTK